MGDKHAIICSRYTAFSSVGRESKGHVSAHMPLFF